MENKVKSLEQFNAAERQELESEFQNLVGLYRKPQYDGFGLRYEPEFLRLMSKTIGLHPIELMAEFVDAVCKSMVERNEFSVLNNQIGTEVNFLNLNTTAVGNFAYVALHCQNEEIKNRALKLVADIQQEASERFSAELKN